MVVALRVMAARRMPDYRDMQRVIGILTVSLFAAACADSHGDEAPAQRRHTVQAEQEPQPVDFRFADPSCDRDDFGGGLPGALVSDGTNLLATKIVSDQAVTIRELGEGMPPELDSPYMSLGEGRYVRMALDDRTLTLILRGVRSQLPFSVGDQVLYSFAVGSAGGWSLFDFTITLRARDGELMLQYGYLGNLDEFELPSGFEVDTSQELCSTKKSCSSIRVATFQDESGASAQIQPGEARSFAGFDIYVYGARIPSGRTEVGCNCFDCRGATIDLLLLRNPK